jgi:hypothetical protein
MALRKIEQINLIEANNQKHSDLAKRIECFTEHELSFLCGVHVATLVKWRATGIGPDYVRLGNDFFYPVASVKNWVDRKTKRVDSLEAAAASEL